MKAEVQCGLSTVGRDQQHVVLTRVNLARPQRFRPLDQGLHDFFQLR